MTHAIPPADPPPAPRWTFGAALRTIGRPEIYRMVLFIYFPLLIPVTVAMALFGRFMDRQLGWAPLPGWPLNVAAFAVLTLAGLLIVWWCYSYLILVGRGGPAPLVARGPTDLVRTGPYALTRHPSVLGKLMGALGLGLLARSPFFVFVILPLLLTGSLLEKWLFMERRELKTWGPEYERYQREVPFFLPRPAGLLRLLRGDPLAGVPEAAQHADADLPPGDGGGDEGGHEDHVGG